MIDMAHKGVPTEGFHEWCSAKDGHTGNENEKKNEDDHTTKPIIIIGISYNSPTVSN